MSGIHQFVPMLHRSDAVGRHTLRLRDVMLERGIRSQVYVEMADPETASETRPFARYGEEAEAGDVLLYQFATASAIAPWLGARSEALVVNYHNVTPPEYFAPWDNGMARHQLLAQTQLRELAPRSGLGLAVSAFNEAELRAAGFGRTAVVPPAAIVPAATRRPPARRRRPWAPAPGGSVSGDSLRTRGSSSRSWRSWSPAPTTIRRRRSTWWAVRWSRPTRVPSIASSTNWASTMPSGSRAR